MFYFFVGGANHLPEALDQFLHPLSFRVVAAELVDKEDIFKRGTKLRGEFTNLSKDFIKQRDAFGRIEAVAAQIKKDPSAGGVGDIALIFNFMKVQDPGSTVREGEFATAENSAGLVPKLRNQYNKILQGDRLTSKQRDDFVNTSKGIFDTSFVQHNKRVEQFSGLATRLGVDPQNVLLDFSLAEQEVAEENIPTGESINQTVTTQVQFDALPSGATFTENGQTFRKP